MCSNSEITCTLRSVDSFHKNCQLMFKDLIESFKGKLKTSTEFYGYNHLFTDYNQAMLPKLDHRANCVFKNKEKAYFIMMIVSINDDFINDSYKIVCKTLGVDNKFPLILTTGIIKTKNLENLKDSDATNALRIWVYQTILSKVGGGPDIPLEQEHSFPFNIKPKDYKLNDLMILKNKTEEANKWCENATFKIRLLTDIKDSNEVGRIAQELIDMEPPPDVELSLDKMQAITA